MAVNCGAISATLIESELFGHERGSFTGAERQHKGHFERANGGTLFLDEITEMPQELQVKLLRVLETGTVMRVGGDEAIKIDVRVVRPRTDGPRRRLPRASCARTSSTASTSSRSSCRRCASGATTSQLLAEQFLDELNTTARHDEGVHPSVPRPAPPPQLAGQRPRAEERGPARVHPGGGRRGHRRAAARRARGVRRVEPGDAGRHVHRRDGAAADPRDARALRGRQEARGLRAQDPLKTLYNRINEYKPG